MEGRRRLTAARDGTRGGPDTRAATAVRRTAASGRATLRLRPRRAQHDLQETGEERVQVLATQPVHLRRSAIRLPEQAAFAQHPEVMGPRRLRDGETDA